MRNLKQNQFTTYGRIAFGFTFAAWVLSLLASCALNTSSQKSATSPPMGDRPAVPVPVTEHKELTELSATAPVRWPEWKTLFDGNTLTGWKVTDFAGHGDVRVENGKLILAMGAALTGINWTNPLPRMDYEIALEATKVDGSDFFCGLTFPVAETYCSFIVGGWGGGVVGISSIDSEDASMNETTKYMGFEKGRWYKIRVRVTRNKIEAWIDQEKTVDLDTTERKITMRYGEIELSKPLGVATWTKTAALRDIKMRSVEATAK
jgi:3-keto-disaccharide hydrolase